MPSFLGTLKNSIGPSQNFGGQRQQIGPTPTMNRVSMSGEGGGLGPSPSFLQTLLASLAAARQSNGYEGPQGPASLQAQGRTRPPGAPTVGMAAPRNDMTNPNMFNAIQAGRMQSIQNQPWREGGQQIITGYGPEPADDSQGNIGAPIYGTSSPIYPNLSTGVGPRNYRLGPGYGSNYGQ